MPATEYWDVVIKEKVNNICKGVLGYKKTKHRQDWFADKNNTGEIKILSDDIRMLNL